MKNVIKLLIISALAPFFLLFLTGCGTQAKGDLMTKNFTETNFHGLDLQLNADVEVRVDSIFKIEITCEENVLPFVETRVENGILQIRFDRSIWDLDGMKIKVSAPKWDNFEVSGAGKIHVLDAISGNDLTTNVSGSGDILLKNAVFTNAIVDVSGSGIITISGQSDALNCDISGVGDVNCFDFLVKTAKIEVSGIGDAEVNVSDFLDAAISGAGDIIYKGAPIVTKNISGTGSIRKF